jgi:undecaprenyl phosphate-alpha-L-ara4N flippase subunit ArnE
MKAIIPTAFIPWAALAGSIVLGACAQVALKYAVTTSDHGRSAFFPKSLGLLFWFVSFVVATYLWIIALAHLDLSYAYPLLGFGYVLVTGLACVLLHERVSRSHWFAVLVIAAGAACIAGSV